MSNGSNLYQQLKDALTTFKNFLDQNTAALKPAIQALKPIVPQVGDLLTKLVSLMNELKTAVQNLNVDQIPGLSTVSSFTDSAKTLLTTAETLLPSEKGAIDDVLGAMNVVGSLPSLKQIKQDILDLITAIITDLTNLNS